MPACLLVCLPACMGDKVLFGAWKKFTEQRLFASSRASSTKSNAPSSSKSNIGGGGFVSPFGGGGGGTTRGGLHAVDEDEELLPEEVSVGSLGGDSLDSGAVQFSQQAREVNSIVEKVNTRPQLRRQSSLMRVRMNFHQMKRESSVQDLNKSSVEVDYEKLIRDFSAGGFEIVQDGTEGVLPSSPSGEQFRLFCLALFKSYARLAGRNAPSTSAATGTGMGATLSGTESIDQGLSAKPADSALSGGAAVGTASGSASGSACAEAKQGEEGPPAVVAAASAAVAAASGVDNGDDDDDAKSVDTASTFNHFIGAGEDEFVTHTTQSHRPELPSFYYDRALQEKLQRGIDDLQMDVVLEAVSEGAVVESQHIIQVSHHLGDQFMPLFTVLISHSTLFFAERLWKQDHAQIINDCQNPINAFLMGSQYERWAKQAVTNREIASLTQNLPMLNMLGGKTASRYLWRLLTLKVIDCRADQLRDTCVVMPETRTVEQEVPEAMKRRKLERLYHIRRSLTQIVNVVTPEKVATELAADAAAAAAARDTDADGDTAATNDTSSSAAVALELPSSRPTSPVPRKTADVGEFSKEACAAKRAELERHFLPRQWIPPLTAPKIIRGPSAQYSIKADEDRDIYTVLREYVLLTGKLANEAKALRGPLMERDHRLYVNGFLKQARADFLALRKECMTPAQKAEELKKQKAKELKKQKALEKKKKAEKKAREKKKKSRKKRQSSKRRRGKGGGGATSDISDSDSDGDFDGGFSSGDDDVLSKLNGDLLKIDFLRSVTADGDTAGRKGGVDDDDDDDDDNRLGGGGMEIQMGGMAEEGDLLAEAEFEQRTKVFKTPIYGEVWQPITWRDRRDVRAAERHRCTEELRRTLKRVVQALQKDHHIGPINLAKSRSEHGGIGMWLVDHMLSDPRKRVSRTWVVVPRDYWSFRAVKERLSLELAGIDGLIQELKSKLGEHKAANRAIEGGISMYQKFLKANRKEILTIAQKRAQKDEQDRSERGPLYSRIRKTESKIKASIKAVQALQSKVNLAEVLMEQDKLKEVAQLFAKPPPPEDPEEAKKNKNKKKAAAAEGDDETTVYSVAMADDLIVQAKEEIDLLQDFRLDLEGKKINLEQTLRNYDWQCARTSRMLRDLAQDRFQNMVEVQQMVVRESNRLDDSEEGRDVGRLRRKYLVRYLKKLTDFVESDIASRGAQLAKEAEERRVTELLHRGSAAASRSPSRATHTPGRGGTLSASTAASSSSRRSPSRVMHSPSGGASPARSRSPSTSNPTTSVMSPRQLNSDADADADATGDIKPTVALTKGAEEKMRDNSALAQELGADNYDQLIETFSPRVISKPSEMLKQAMDGGGGDSSVESPGEVGEGGGRGSLGSPDGGLSRTDSMLSYEYEQQLLIEEARREAEEDALSQLNEERALQLEERRGGVGLTVDEEIALAHKNSAVNIKKEEERLRLLAEQQAAELATQELRMQMFEQYWSSLPQPESEEEKKKGRRLSQMYREAILGKIELEAVMEDDVASLPQTKARKMWNSIGKAHFRTKEAFIRRLVQSGIDNDNISFASAEDPFDEEITLPDMLERLTGVGNDPHGGFNDELSDEEDLDYPSPTHKLEHPAHLADAFKSATAGDGHRRTPLPDGTISAVANVDDVWKATAKSDVVDSISISMKEITATRESVVRNKNEHIHEREDAEHRIEDAIAKAAKLVDVSVAEDMAEEMRSEMSLGMESSIGDTVASSLRNTDDIRSTEQVKPDPFAAVAREEFQRYQVQLHSSGVKQVRELQESRRLEAELQAAQNVQKDAEGCCYVRHGRRW